jgi:hypothetical protein
VRILVSLASAMTACGRSDRAAALARQAAATASGIRDAGQRAQATDLLTRPSRMPLADRDTGAEPPDTAGIQQTHADAAEQVRSLIDRIRVAGAPGSGTVRELGDEAARLARSFACPYRRAKTLGTIATAVAASNADVPVHGLISEANEHAGMITDPSRHADVLQTLASVAAAVGDLKQCRRFGTSLPPSPTS